MLISHRAAFMDGDRRDRPLRAEHKRFSSILGMPPAIEFCLIIATRYFGATQSARMSHHLTLRCHELMADLVVDASRLYRRFHRRPAGHT